MSLRRYDMTQLTDSTGIQQYASALYGGEIYPYAPLMKVKKVQLC